LGPGRKMNKEGSLKSVVDDYLTEKDFRQQVIDLAHYLGYMAYFSWTSIHSPAGFPDLILVRDNVIMAVELKTEKGKTTLAQEEWLSALSKAGVRTYIWKPSDWDNIVRCLSNDKTSTNSIPGMR